MAGDGPRVLAFATFSPGTTPVGSQMDSPNATFLCRVLDRVLFAARPGRNPVLVLGIGLTVGSGRRSRAGRDLSRDLQRRRRCFRH